MPENAVAIRRRSTFSLRSLAELFIRKNPLHAMYCGILLILPLQAMGATTTSTTLSLSSQSVAPGSVITMTASVTDASGHAVSRGLVRYCNSTAAHCEDSAILGSAQLTSAGSATLKLRFGVGSHSVQAHFVGTTTDAASSSTVSTVTVNGIAPSTTSLVSSGTVGMYTLTATVGGTGSASPTGSVSFSDTSNGGATVGSAHLAAGTQAISFQPYVTYATGVAPDAVAVGDFNNDGIPDIAVPNSGSQSPSISVLLGNGDGTFQTQKTYATDADPQSIVVGDLNGDGKLDIVTDNPYSGDLSIFLGNGDGTFQTASTYSSGQDLNGLAIGDFNNDGIPDLVTALTQSPSVVRILLGNGDGTFTSVSTYTVGNSPDGVIVADFNGDGNLDVATANYGSNTISILLGKGNGTFNTAVGVSPGEQYPTSLAAGDFNGDGIVDLAVGNEDYHLNENYVLIMLGNGDGTFKTPTTVPTPASPWLSATGDFNNDGKLDLAVSSVTGAAVSLLLGNGDGTFQAASNYPSTNSLWPLAIADLNGDGSPDLIVPNSGSSEVSVYLETRWSATAAVSNVVVTGTPTTHLIAATYAGDTNYSSSTSASVGITSGQASQAITFPAPSTPVVYGVAPIQLTATASSGLSVTYSATGPATVTGSSLSITGAGTVVVTASQAGNANYSAATQVSRTITVTKAPLTVTANNASKIYGAAIPTFTVSYKGFVNQDTVSVLSGSPSLTTSATPTSPVGSYTITAAAGTLTASNYSFTFANGVLTITTAVAATPTFSLAAGTYHGSQQLTISDATSGATIYYTTNGTTPTTSSSKYSAALTISASETVEAIAVFPSNYTQSATMSAAYVIQ